MIRTLIELDNTSASVAAPDYFLSIDGNLIVAQIKPEQPVQTQRRGERDEAWRDVFRRLNEFRKLPPGWDTYGGIPPTMSAYARTVVLLDRWREFARQSGEILPSPFAAPCGNGSIQVEWSIGRRNLEIEVPAASSEPFKWLTAFETGKGMQDHTGEFQNAEEELAKRLMRWLITEK